MWTDEKVRIKKTLKNTKFQKIINRWKFDIDFSRRCRYAATAQKKKNGYYENEKEAKNEKRKTIALKKKQVKELENMQKKG